MNPITQICPVSDTEAAHLVRSVTMDGLAEDIIRSAATSPADMPPADARSVTGSGTGLRGAWRPRLRRRLLIGVPVAAALAVTGLIATSVGAPGQHLGPVSVGPPKAQAAALEFIRHGRYIEVIVRNPVADPKRYRAEFAVYHLNISLTMVPASPSSVGTLVAEGLSAGASDLKPITARGRCFTRAEGDACPVGVEVPVDFRGSATIVFGRAARPGEHYDAAGDPTARGEAMHGLPFQGKTVAAVLAMLARRGVTVAFWRVQLPAACYTEELRSVPGDWLVYQAVPFAPGEVVLWAAKALPVPACTPTPGAPTPSASPTAGL
ncbi:MAG TPA: hypothetical protein VLM11_23315 [Streptosporangiaceae bacterium]|nr:hypothetical protein [Streptosporangiaceae bacterium]